MKKVYIAGPMRGHKEYNFPAFDAAEKELSNRGYQVVSPARLDRESGFDPKKDDANMEFLSKAWSRNFSELCLVDEIHLLPGWEKSSGTQLEVRVGEALTIPCFDYVTGAYIENPVGERSICAIADALTHGDRNSDYGHPLDNFEHTASLWRSMFGWDCEWQHVAQAMILVKLSRQAHRPKNDNLVDIAGYSNCEWMGQEELLRRQAQSQTEGSN